MVVGIEAFQDCGVAASVSEVPYWIESTVTDEPLRPVSIIGIVCLSNSVVPSEAKRMPITEVAAIEGVTVIDWLLTEKEVLFSNTFHFHFDSLVSYIYSLTVSFPSR